MYTMKHTSARSIKYPHWKEMNLYVYPRSYTKINSRWIIDLNIKGKIIKFTEGNTGEYLGLSRFQTPKLKIILIKNIIKRVKKQARMGEDI